MFAYCSRAHFFSHGTVWNGSDFGAGIACHHRSQLHNLEARGKKEEGIDSSQVKN